MYNPAGVDFNSSYNREWIEIFNPAAAAVDLSGWQFGDSRTNQWATPFPTGTTLGPMQALVVTGDVATFDANWGLGVNRLEVGNFPPLTNSPSPTQGSVALRDGNARIRDEVNYDDALGWPTSNGDQGSSIFLLPNSLSPLDNDVGANWRPSSAGVYRARYVNGGGHGTNYGSPGYVATIPQTPFAPSPDALWSMVVLPDTQNYVKLPANNPIFGKMTTWIRDNRDAFNIALVLHEGDIVNRNQGVPSNGENPANAQWSNAKTAMSILDGVVPYVLAVGNHDLGVSSAENRSTQLNSYYRASDNPLVDPAQEGILRGTYQSDRLENAYYELRAPDGRDVLILSLEFGPRQAVVDWARQIVERPEYAEHTVVLLTHEYLTGADRRSDHTLSLPGTPQSYGIAGDAHDGEQLWEELVGSAGNFEFVFNGHYGGDQVGASPFNR